MKKNILALTLMSLVAGTQVQAADTQSSLVRWGVSAVVTATAVYGVYNWFNKPVDAVEVPVAAVDEKEQIKQKLIEKVSSEGLEERRKALECRMTCSIHATTVHDSLVGGKTATGELVLKKWQEFVNTKNALKGKAEKAYGNDVDTLTAEQKKIVGDIQEYLDRAKNKTVTNDVKDKSLNQKLKILVGFIEEAKLLSAKVKPAVKPKPQPQPQTSDEEEQAPEQRLMEGDRKKMSGLSKEQIEKRELRATALLRYPPVHTVHNSPVGGKTATQLNNEVKEQAPEQRLMEGDRKKMSGLSKEEIEKRELRATALLRYPIVHTVHNSPVGGKNATQLNNEVKEQQKVLGSAVKDFFNKKNGQ